MSQAAKTIAAIALAGCALSACTSTTPAAAPAAQASTGQAPTAQASAGSAPTTPTPTAPAATAPAPTTRAPDPAKKPVVDWARVAFKTLGCPANELGTRAVVASTRHADLTGDGRRETIVAASCPTTTSTNPVQVFAYDGADVTDSPESLLAIGKGQDLRSVRITTSGRSITVNATALSKKASLCCADLRIIQTYRWDGSDFSRTRFEQTKL
jgi:hypothetical protein